MKDWSTSLPDWEDRIVKGESLMPVGALFPDSAQDALDVFGELTLADAPNGPEKLGTLSRRWVLEIAETLFGALDPETKRRHITQYFLCISKKNGKALALDTPIPTPSGWSTMGDLSVGDYVIGANGKPVKIIAESDVFTDHDCYRVNFSNGESVIADAGHKWFVSALNESQRFSVKTTEQIAAKVDYHGAKNFSLRMPSPMDLPDVDLPIEPYTLGAWLGDGTSDAANITSMDDEILDAIRNDGYQVRYLRNNGSKASTYSIGGRDRSLCRRGHDKRGKIRCSKCEKDKWAGDWTEFSLFEVLKQSGLIGNKHIPAQYLRASYEQRLALLQGLMDTDGTINKKGDNLSIVTVKEVIANGISELMSSLGIKHSVLKRETKIDGRHVGYAYYLQFNAFRDELPVFKLSRKLERMKFASDKKNTPRSKSVQIARVERVESVPVKCISVDSDDHLFLFGRSMLPTHNSSIAAGIMLTALIVNHRPSAEFLILGPTKETADNAFKPIRDMIKAEPELEARFQVQEHLRTVTDRLNSAVLKVVAADSGTVTGKKATGVFIDELHEFGKSAKAAHMLTEATGGLASRPEGFVFYCTTQSSEPPAGVFADKLRYARGVRDGKISDNKFLPIIYEFPNSWLEANKHRDLANAFVTNPNWGLSVDEAFMQQKYQEAQESGEESVKDFMSKHLNVQTSMHLRNDRWPGADYWEGCEIALSLEDLIERSEVITMGIDGGGLDDLLGAYVLGREKGTQKKLGWGYAWAHPSVLERRKEIAPALKDFAKAGEMRLVDRVGDDVDELVGIAEQLLESEKLDIIGCDPVGLGAILDKMEEAGIPEDKLRAVSQGWKLGGAIKTAERWLASGEFLPSSQAMMRWCVGNARIEPRANSILITKQASGSAKIDPVIAMLNAVSLMALNPAAPGERFRMFGLG